jgi:predicted nucleotidyltransferase
LAEEGEQGIVMRTLRELTEIPRDSMDSLKSRYPISWIGVFGSYLTGEQTKTSDFGVLVDFHEPIGLFRFLELEHDLQGLLAVRGDLVSKKSLKPHIAERVLRQVVLV